MDRRDPRVPQGGESRSGLSGRVPLAVVVVDAQGLVSHWSTGARRLFGRAKEEALGPCGGRPAAGVGHPARRRGRFERSRVRPGRGPRPRSRRVAQRSDVLPDRGPRPTLRPGSRCPVVGLPAGRPRARAAAHAGRRRRAAAHPARGGGRPGRVRADRARLRAAHGVPRRRGAGQAAAGDPAQHERRREPPDRLPGTRTRLSGAGDQPARPGARHPGLGRAQAGRAPRGPHGGRRTVRPRRVRRRPGKPPRHSPARSRTTSNTPPYASTWSSSTRSAGASAPPSTWPVRSRR